MGCYPPLGAGGSHRPLCYITPSLPWRRSLGAVVGSSLAAVYCRCACARVGGSAGAFPPLPPPFP